MAYPIALPIAAALAAAPGIYGLKKISDNSPKKKREADAEMKRESRGVEKPANFDAKQESIQDAKDAKDRKKISDMGYKKGGFVRSADGVAQRGKTRGKMC